MIVDVEVAGLRPESIAFSSGLSPAARRQFCPEDLRKAVVNVTQKLTKAGK
jgi:hypothetical protein